MPAAALPPHEADRLADLREHGILDASADPTLDALVRLAAEAFSVPIAAVSLVDADRQWFRASVGLGVCETSRDASFCAHTILGRGAMVVEDARSDDRFRDNPLVTGEPGIRFYAGVPLRSARGNALGSFCIVDTRPRRLDRAKRDRLAALAAQAARLIELEHRATSADRRGRLDPLTGLLNAGGFAAAVEDSLVSQDGTLIVSLRLRRFDAVAAGSGEAADDLVREAADRLHRAAATLSSRASGGCVGRLAGGVFGVVLGCDGNPSAAAPAAVATLEASLDPAVIRRGRRLSLAAALGFAAGPRAAARDAGVEAANLIGRANLAMAEAEAEAGAGGGTSRSFEPPMLLRAQDSADLESDLRVALAAGDVRPALQPIIHLESSYLVGFETLARWTHPTRGPVSPATFVPLAERAGLADPLFGAVAEPAMAALPRLAPTRSLGAERLPLPFLSLNLSKLQLRDADLAGRIQGMAGNAGLATDRIHLELTESQVAESPEAIATMHRLDEAGFALMLDDFGTGTSTLASLHRYPVKWLKIDRGFTAAAVRGWRVAVIANTVAELAQKLGMRTVAEGIETADELPMFQAMGFGLGQGYHFARPMDVESAEAWVRDSLVEGRWHERLARAA